MKLQEFVEQLKAIAAKYPNSEIKFRFLSQGEEDPSTWVFRDLAFAALRPFPADCQIWVVADLQREALLKDLPFLAAK